MRHLRQKQNKEADGNWVGLIQIRLFEEGLSEQPTPMGQEGQSHQAEGRASPKALRQVGFQCVRNSKKAEWLKVVQAGEREQEIDHSPPEECVFY